MVRLPRNKGTPPLPERDRVRVNGMIDAPQVRVIGGGGEMLGVMTPHQALAHAEEAGLDLVEVSPMAAPPVCKLLDYGKFRYQQQKKRAEARRKQKTIDVKEIKMRPSIEAHDYDVKFRSALRFLGEGDKVKVTIRFRGREMAHQDIGLGVLKRLCSDLEGKARVDQEPQMEGRRMMMILTPSK